MIISIVALAAIVLIIFLIRKNRKDIEVLNPDAQDSTEEIHNDQERNRGTV